MELTRQLRPPVRTTTRPLHRWIAVLPAFMAFWAWVGSAGLVTGRVDVGPSVAADLPFASPVFGGVALALVVAVPMTAAAVAAGLDLEVAPRAVVAAGVLLVGWSVAETAFIGVQSWLQPACLGWGVVTIGVGVARLSRAPEPR